MKISAVIRNAQSHHAIAVSTAGVTQTITVPAKTEGRGSAVNGSEFLMLALATCYCNDLYREAVKLGVSIDSVEIEAEADFPGVGLAATNIRYKAKVESSAPKEVIAELLCETDSVAEIHNTVRSGVPVSLVDT